LKKKAEDFSKKHHYAAAIKNHLKTENFVKKNLDKIKGFSTLKSVEDRTKKKRI
jgi:hypothetical protein